MRRIVLDPSVPREAIEATATACGWPLRRAAGPDELEPYNVAWGTGRGCDSVIQYMEDDLLGARYLVVTGSQVDETAMAIEQRLDTVALDTAIRRFSSAVTLEEVAQALSQAVIAADVDVPEPAVLAVIRQGLTNRFPDLRRTAIAACTYLNWKELDVLLTEVIRRDPDPDVTRLASDVLALRQHHEGAAG